MGIEKERQKAKRRKEKGYKEEESSTKKAKERNNKKMEEKKKAEKRTTKLNSLFFVASPIFSRFPSFQPSQFSESIEIIPLQK